MTGRRLLSSTLVGGALWLGRAEALPSVAARGQVPRSAALLGASVGTRGLDLGLAWPFDVQPAATAYHLALSPGVGTAQLGAEVIWSIARSRRVSLAGALGLSGTGVLRGPLDAGAGAQTSLLLGVSLGPVELGLGPEAGAELFLRSGGPRFPLRGLLSLGVWVGDWRLGLLGRAGADLEPGRFADGRADASVTAAYRYALPSR